MEEVSERIKQVLALYNGSANQLAKKYHMNQATVNNQVSGKCAVGMRVLSAVLETYPKISADWLVMGYGEMMRTTPRGAVINQSIGGTQNNNNGTGNQHISSIDPEYKRLMDSVIAGKDALIKEKETRIAEMREEIKELKQTIKTLRP